MEIERGRGRNNGRLIGEKYLELLVCERAVCGIFLDIPGGRDYSIEWIKRISFLTKIFFLISRNDREKDWDSVEFFDFVMLERFVFTDIKKYCLQKFVIKWNM